MDPRECPKGDPPEVEGDGLEREVDREGGARIVVRLSTHLWGLEGGGGGGGDPASAAGGEAPLLDEGEDFRGDEAGGGGAAREVAVAHPTPAEVDL